MLEAQGCISEMPEGYWKDRYQAILKDKFGHLIKEAKKASLDPSDAREDEEEEK